MSMLALTFTQIKINTVCSCYYGQQPGTQCVCGFLRMLHLCLEIITAVLWYLLCVQLLRRFYEYLYFSRFHLFF